VLAGRVLCFPINGFGYLANDMGAANAEIGQGRNSLRRRSHSERRTHRGSQLPTNAFHNVLLRRLSANQISDLLGPTFFGYMPVDMPSRNRKFGKGLYQDENSRSYENGHTPLLHSLLPGSTQDARARGSDLPDSERQDCWRNPRATISRKASTHRRRKWRTEMMDNSVLGFQWNSQGTGVDKSNPTIGSV
jgi:hypothetical protein